MALTPFPSSIGWGSNPRPSDREPSTLPLDHSFRLIADPLHESMSRLLAVTETGENILEKRKWWRFLQFCFTARSIMKQKYGFMQDLVLFSRNKHVRNWTKRIELWKIVWRIAQIYRRCKTSKCEITMYNAVSYLTLWWQGSQEFCCVNW